MARITTKTLADMNELYHIERLPLKTVGEILGVSHTTVGKYVKNKRKQGSPSSEHEAFDKWEDEELEYFLNNWEYSDQNEMALDLGKSVRQIKNKAQYLRSKGVIKPKFIRFKYTEKDIEYIIKNFKHLTIQELAYGTRTTLKQTRSMVNYLKKEGKIEPKYRKKELIRNSVLQQ